jgi:hypothetical protein
VEVVLGFLRRLHKRKTAANWAAVSDPVKAEILRAHYFPRCPPYAVASFPAEVGFVTFELDLVAGFFDGVLLIADFLVTAIVISPEF